MLLDKVDGDRHEIIEVDRALGAEQSLVAAGCFSYPVSGPRPFGLRPRGADD